MTAVAVLYERGRAGAAALEEGLTRAGDTGGDLTVVVIAPQAPYLSGCMASPDAVNDAVCEQCEAELREADRLLGNVGSRAGFVLLVEGRDLPLAAWAAAREIDVILLPARHSLIGPRRHPALRALRKMAGLEVRVVSAPRRPASMS